MTFHLGQKVVCINDDWFGEPDLPLYMFSYLRTLPIKSAVYRVRSVDDQSPPYIRLVEVVNPLPPEPTDEVHFNSEHFRPVIATETDISIFTKLLTPNPQRRELVSSVIGEDINTL